MRRRRRRCLKGEYARPAPKKIEVAKGIYLIVSQPYGDVGLDGNAVATLSSDGVLVFDSNGTPAASAAVLTELRGLTNKPVKYVVNSHWYWDQAREEVLPRLHDLMVTMTKDDPKANEQFRPTSSIGTCTGSTTS